MMDSRSPFLRQPTPTASGVALWMRTYFVAKETHRSSTTRRCQHKFKTLLLFFLRWRFDIIGSIGMGVE